MFTGIVEELGRVRSLTRGPRSCVLSVEADIVTQGLALGDSVAVNGICLTATSVSAHGFTADVMPETLRRSSLAAAAFGTRVNLERAMAAGGRFGGHIVSGHVDGVGTVAEVRREANAVWFAIRAESAVMRLAVEKGSVAVDGISLTVARLLPGGEGFEVSVIPHTLEVTTLGRRGPGSRVNLENDVIGKYVERLLGQRSSASAPAPEPAARAAPSAGGITAEFLAANGF